MIAQTATKTSTHDRPAGAAPPIDTRLHPLVALRAARALIATGDTKQVFILLRAMRGRSGVRNFRRFAESDVGRTVLSQ